MWGEKEVEVRLGSRLVGVASPPLPDRVFNISEMRGSWREEKCLYVGRKGRDRELERGEFNFFSCFCLCFGNCTKGPTKKQKIEQIWGKT